MSTELQKADGDRSTSEIIRAGADLDEGWNEAKIAAARELVPQSARSPGTMIAYLARATNAGLNPFQGEIHAWEDRGEITFHVAREGWVKILRRDPEIESYEVACVFEEDEFSWEKDEAGNIRVNHGGGIRRGNLLGAYCVLHMKDEPDHIELRLLEDYSHLHGKTNWKNHPQDMMTARVTSAAAKAKSEKAAGLVDEAGMQMGNAGQAVGAAASRKAAEQTEDEADVLAAELAEEEEEEMPEPSEDGGREIEAEASEVEEGKAESKPSGTPSTTEGEATASSSESPSNSEAPSSKDTGEASGTSSTTPDHADDEPDETITCEICTQEVARSSYPGHKGGHSRSGYKLPEAVVRVEKNPEGDGPPYVFLDQDGVLHEGALSWEKTVKKAQEWAADQSSEDEHEAEELPLDERAESSESESDPSEEDGEGDPDIPWDQAYSKVMMTARDHPDGLDFMRRTAQDVFEGRDVPRNDDGMVQTSELSVLQLAELKSKMEEEIEEAEF